jgi:hypothetical protein
VASALARCAVVVAALRAVVRADVRVRRAALRVLRALRLAVVRFRVAVALLAVARRWFGVPWFEPLRALVERLEAERVERPLVLRRLLLVVAMCLVLPPPRHESLGIGNVMILELTTIESIAANRRL